MTLKQDKRSVLEAAWQKIKNEEDANTAKETSSKNELQNVWAELKNKEVVVIEQRKNTQMAFQQCILNIEKFLQIGNHKEAYSILVKLEKHPSEISRQMRQEISSARVVVEKIMGITK